MEPAVEPLKHGWLVKTTRGFVASKHRRYTVLLAATDAEPAMLVNFVKDGKEPPSGRQLATLREEGAVLLRSGKLASGAKLTIALPANFVVEEIAKSAAFVVRTPDGERHFEAENAADRDAWCTALRAASPAAEDTKRAAADQAAADAAPRAADEAAEATDRFAPLPPCPTVAREPHRAPHLFARSEA